MKRIILGISALFIFAGCGNESATFTSSHWISTSVTGLSYSCNHPRGSDILWFKNNTNDWIQFEYRNPPDRDRWEKESRGPQSETDAPLGDCGGTFEFRER